MIFPGARALVEAHEAKGHTVVIASSATPPQIMPAAYDLGITNILATEYQVDDRGVLTGKVAGDIRWGADKAKAMQEFAAAHDIDMSESFGYSNGAEDVPMLESVGRPRPLNATRGSRTSPTSAAGLLPGCSGPRASGRSTSPAAWAPTGRWASGWPWGWGQRW